MDKIVTDKAERKLARMSAALEVLRSSSIPQEIEDAWELFIMACGSLYSTLEQGSKATPQVRQWFEGKKTERRADQLLSYVHQARNAEEHGTMRITDRGSSQIELKSRGAFVELKSDGKSSWKVANSAGDIEYSNDIVRLVTVYRDRGRDRFDPPELHLGRPVTGSRPLQVAEAVYAYCEGMLREATAFS